MARRASSFNKGLPAPGAGCTHAPDDEAIAPASRQRFPDAASCRVRMEAGEPGLADQPVPGQLTPTVLAILFLGSARTTTPWLDAYDEALSNP